MGVTLGTPISLFVKNEDQVSFSSCGSHHAPLMFGFLPQRPKDYSNLVEIPRPSHADYTYQESNRIRVHVCLFIHSK